ncbi:MAG: peptide ABC transporter substrate-binding protein [Candidatus Doudnabacteria bacterium]|nr:peptide ABC transporter substrate-binding protein [Candidatus Doudnabacteria bacterium]
MIRNWLLKLKNFGIKAYQGLRLLPKLSRSQILSTFEAFQKKDLIAIVGLGGLFFIAVILLLTTRAGFSNGPGYGGEITEGLVGQPRFINPVYASASSIDSDLTKVMFAQLLKFDKDLNLVPDLAESLPEVSADQKTYTIKLKPNLKWQDGKPLLADDVVFTINVIQNPDYESPLRANWARVKVEKIDDLTVKLTLREVSASFLTNFTLGILPKHVWEGLTPNGFRLSDNNLKPVGSGPFSIREIKKTSDGTIKSLTLKANDFYHEGRPYLNRMTFKFYDDNDQLVAAFHGKDIANIGYVPFDKKTFVEDSERSSQYRINLPQYEAVFFNLKNPVLADKAVRQALWLTTDRKKIVDEVYMGFSKETYGPILVGNLGYNPEVETRTHNSLTEAIDILNRGGWALDPTTNIRVKNKRPLEINLATNNFVLNVKTAQVLESQWEALGAQVNLVIVSANELEQQYIRPRNFEALLFAENTGPDPDPFAFWHSSQSRDPGLNLSGFSNAEVDKLLTTARQTNDVNVRAKNYQQFQLIVLDQLPAIFLNSAIYVYNTPPKLKGIDLETIIHPSERFLDVKNWYTETK